VASILIAYGSGTGQTAKIAETMARQIRTAGYEVDLADLKSSSPDPQKYDGAVIGAPVRKSRHMGIVERYARRHKTALQGRPTAFFSVCMAVTGGAGGARIAQQWLADFTANTGWQPALQTSFAGALSYTRYGIFTRWFMKKIAEKSGHSTDTSRDHEFTDWGAVAKFTDEFLAKLG
jgi:menaquinone-dependent protoporphyrinogen oxidase